MRVFKPFIGATLLLLLGASNLAVAKDLAGRLGVGYNNEFSNSTANRQVPTLSAKYGVAKDIHIQGDLGFNTSGTSAFTLAGKLYKNIFYETNLNFYTAAGLAYLKDVQSGVELLGVFGAEFFIPGVDSLGLLFEAGVSASNVTGSFALKTVGYSFINAGMHFYF